MRNLLKVLLLGTVLVSQAMVASNVRAYEPADLARETWDAIKSGADATVGAVQEGSSRVAEGVDKYLVPDYMRTTKYGGTGVGSPDNVTPGINPVTDANASAWGGGYNPSQDIFVGREAGKGANYGEVASSDPSVTGNYDSLYGSGYSDTMNAARTQWDNGFVSSPNTNNTSMISGGGTTPEVPKVSELSNPHYTLEEAGLGGGSNGAGSGAGGAGASGGVGKYTEITSNSYGDANTTKLVEIDGKTYQIDGDNVKLLGEGGGDAGKYTEITSNNYGDTNTTKLLEIDGKTYQIDGDNVKLLGEQSSNGTPDGLPRGGEDGLLELEPGADPHGIPTEEGGAGVDSGAKPDPNAASKKMDAKGDKAKSETEAGAKKMDPIPYKVVHYNYAEYALLIWEAIKGNEVEDATKEVTVRGAEAMQDSQGSQGGGASGGGSTGIPVQNTAMSGTSIGGAASAMISLLNNALIDLSLLSEEIEKGKQQEMKGAVQAQTGKSQSGVDASETGVVSETTQNLSTSEYKEIKKRRNLLLAEWATAATQIGEGSNAISSDFYSRSAAFSAAANAASGSLGGINAITDTDRFVLFEQTRAAALSAIELGLQGAVNLNDLEDNVVVQEDSSGPKSGTDISSSFSQ